MMLLLSELIHGVVQSSYQRICLEQDPPLSLVQQRQQACHRTGIRAAKNGVTNYMKQYIFTAHYIRTLSPDATSHAMW